MGTARPVLLADRQGWRVTRRQHSTGGVLSEGSGGLSPELPLAQNLYALLEIDQGRAQDAIVRLVERGLSGSVQPGLYAALVQACRFCGLLEASAAAHEHARQLDRNVLTSVELTYLQLGDDERLFEHIERPYFGVISPTHRTMLAMRLGELGRRDEAVRRLRELEREKLSGVFRANVSLFRATFEGRREESLSKRPSRSLTNSPTRSLSTTLRASSPTSESESVPSVSSIVVSMRATSCIAPSPETIRGSIRSAAVPSSIASFDGRSHAIWRRAPRIAKQEASSCSASSWSRPASPGDV